jgi:hypothetical protein
MTHKPGSLPNPAPCLTLSLQPKRNVNAGLQACMHASPAHQFLRTGLQGSPLPHACLIGIASSLRRSIDPPG